MKIIDVVCFVFPTGETYWTDDTENTKQVVNNFKDANPDVDECCTMGMVQVRMPEDVYSSIPATQFSYELSKPTGGRYFVAELERQNMQSRNED